VIDFNGGDLCKGGRLPGQQKKEMKSFNDLRLTHSSDSYDAHQQDSATDFS
jgi:hypothetical protein